MAHVFDTLGKSVLPKVFDKLKSVGLSDRLNVVGETVTAGSGGGRIKSGMTNIYTDIPVQFQPSSGNTILQGQQLVSENQYLLIFPTHAKDGTRYNIDPKNHRLVVQARSGANGEPSKTFRILSIKDKQGNMFEAYCVKEN